MTQELIADMLGVRREGVTVAAGRLQDAGAISYVRGHIKILDRQKLEDTVSVIEWSKTSSIVCWGKLFNCFILLILGVFTAPEPALIKSGVDDPC